MPIYSYVNTQTNEEVDLTMSMSEMDEFEKTNTHMRRVYDRMNIGDSVALGVTKVPSDFSKYVLGKVEKVAGADKGKLYKRWDKAREW
jgi:hypothetical protein